jgi:hypothetical protein
MTYTSDTRNEYVSRDQHTLPAQGGSSEAECLYFAGADDANFRTWQSGQLLVMIPVDHV